MGLFGFKDLMGSRVRGIESKSIWQDESHRADRTIRILGHAAAHPAGIVGKDTAHHAGVDGGRVWSDAAAEWFEHVVEKSANDTRFSADQACLIFHMIVSPVAGDIHKYAVSDRLPGETRPRG